ncbi:HAD-IA family hydrolase [Candidatus Micrarchaeota archaeon]|nr:HAD-IA family hydrolase [Candidatus Micrarchaeota archaeon]
MGKVCLKAVVFDVDGVLVDVSGSYREAIVRTVNGYLNKVGVRSKRMFSKPDVQAFKNAGGFNDDWNLTYAGVLYCLLNALGEKRSLKDFLARVEKFGGGLKGVERLACESRLWGEVRRCWRTDDCICDNPIKRLFQENFLGRKFFREVYGFASRGRKKGLIGCESLFLSEPVLSRLRDCFKLMGVFTGRPRFEAMVLFEREKIARLFDCIVASEDVSRGKPDPQGLKMVLRKLKLKPSECCYVGDSVDDVRAARRARMVAVGTVYHLKNASEKRKLKKLFYENGASVVVESVGELNKFFSKVKELKNK